MLSRFRTSRRALQGTIVLIGLGISTSGFAQDQPDSHDVLPRVAVDVDGALRRDLAAPDDEWQVLRPRILRIIELREAIAAGRSERGAALPEPAVGGPPANDRAGTDVESSAATIRCARRKAVADLLAAEQDLTDLLTHRQEAILVVAEVLD